MNAKLRAQRVRFKLRQNSNGRVRLSIFKSLRHLHVQAIDDTKHATLASATTNSKDFSLKNAKRNEKAKWVGETIAKKLLKINVKQIYLDRGSYAYAGVIKVLADAARAGGLDF